MPGGIEETSDTSARVTGLWVEILTELVLKTKQEVYYLMVIVSENSVLCLFGMGLRKMHSVYNM